MRRCRPVVSVDQFTLEHASRPVDWIYSPVNELTVD